MTRKRFIKLLMSKWYSRNQANRIANLIFKSYKDTFSDIKMWNETEYLN